MIILRRLSHMNNIRSRREELGLTLKDIAAQIGVHFTTVSGWEKGDIVPRDNNMRKLSAILGIPKEKLLMKTSMQKAIHSGTLNIGSNIPCFVLEDTTRVISGRSLTTAIGMKGRGQGTARITEHRALKQHINNKLSVAIKNPIKFLGVGNKMTYGYEATVLQELCEAILVARDNGSLKTIQEKRYAEYAEILIRSFAKVGIIALIDEVTGFQDVRDRQALNKLLEGYITTDLQKWVKTFPDEFYRNLFRLRGWPYNPLTTNRPGVTAYYTVNLIYERLAPGVLDELRELNKKERGKGKLFQHLSNDIGHPKLREHIHSVMALQRACGSDWDLFMSMLDRAFPKYMDGKQLRLFVGKVSNDDIVSLEG